MKAAPAVPAEGIDTLFAALLDGAPQTPGDAAQILNTVFPPQASPNLPGAAQIAANPAAQIVQAARNVSVQQLSAQPSLNVQPPPADQPKAAPNTKQQAPANDPAQDAMPNASAIVTEMTAVPDQPAVRDADNNAPAPRAPKPKDKAKADPQPDAAAIPVFVPLPQMAAVPKAGDNIAVNSATSTPAQPAVAQQALDHAQSAVIQMQAQAKAAPPAPQHEPSSPAPQISQNPSAPVKFDLPNHTGGQNAHSDNREQHNPQSAQSAATALPAAASQPQTKNNNVPAVPPAASAMAATTLQAPVHTNLVVQPAAQNANPPPMAYDIGAMAITIAAKSQGGDHHFDIRLDPPELGSIAVHLSVDHSGQAMAHLTADKPETLQLLQNDSGNLQNALRDAGLNLANNGLNFSLRGDQRQAGQSFQRGTSRARNLSVSAVAAPTASSAPISSYAPGALDITI